MQEFAIRGPIWVATSNHALSGPMTFAPVWRDKREDAFNTQTLRDACRSSNALHRARIDGRQAELSPDLTIQKVELVGSIALNLAFSDGEDRGIYPWRFLRELADTQITTESN